MFWKHVLRPTSCALYCILSPVKLLYTNKVNEIIHSYLKSVHGIILAVFSHNMRGIIYVNYSFELKIVQ